MTPIAWVVEQSLQQDERFRHLTVRPTLDQVVDGLIREVSIAYRIPVRMLLGYGKDEK